MGVVTGFIKGVAWGITVLVVLFWLARACIAQPQEVHDETVLKLASYIVAKYDIPLEILADDADLSHPQAIQARREVVAIAIDMGVAVAMCKMNLPRDMTYDEKVKTCDNEFWAKLDEDYKEYL